MRAFVHLCFGVALLLSAPAFAAPQQPAERQEPERKPAITRELEALGKELDQVAESIRRTAKELEQETRSAAEEAGKRIEKETEKVLPEVRRVLGDLQRGLEKALGGTDKAAQDAVRNEVTGTIETLEGDHLTLSGVSSGPATLKLDEHSLVRKGDERVSLLALRPGLQVRIDYEKSGDAHLARQIEILP